jgi:hypothetical protein
MSWNLGATYNPTILYSDSPLVCQSDNTTTNILKQTFIKFDSCRILELLVMAVEFNGTIDWYMNVS